MDIDIWLLYYFCFWFFLLFVLLMGHTIPCNEPSLLQTKTIE